MVNRKYIPLPGHFDQVTQRKPPEQWCNIKKERLQLSDYQCPGYYQYEQFKKVFVLIYRWGQVATCHSIVFDVRVIKLTLFVKLKLTFRYFKGD
jgi:hypothetical protein